MKHRILTLLSVSCLACCSMTFATQIIHPSSSPIPWFVGDIDNIMIDHAGHYTKITVDTTIKGKPACTARLTNCGWGEDLRLQPGEETLCYNYPNEPVFILADCDPNTDNAKATAGTVTFFKK